MNFFLFCIMFPNDPLSRTLSEITYINLLDSEYKGVISSKLKRRSCFSFAESMKRQPNRKLRRKS